MQEVEDKSAAPAPGTAAAEVSRSVPPLIKPFGTPKPAEVLPTGLNASTLFLQMSDAAFTTSFRIVHSRGQCLSGIY